MTITPTPSLVASPAPDRPTPPHPQHPAGAHSIPAGCTYFVRSARPDTVLDLLPPPVRCDAAHYPHDHTRPGACQAALLKMLANMDTRSDERLERLRDERGRR